MSFSIKTPSEFEYVYRKLNVHATVRLVELAAASGVKSFVFVSSVKAGGYDEDDLETKPDGVYGQTKREAELKVLEIGLGSGMHVSIVRPSLVYGPRVKGNLALMLKGIEQGWFEECARATAGCCQRSPSVRRVSELNLCLCRAALLPAR